MSRVLRPELASTPPALLDRELRSAVSGMSRRLRGVPRQFRAFVYDVTRTEKRVKPLGQYPSYAATVLRSGAPLSDALKPLDELRGWLLSHVPALHCLATTLENEQKEQGEADNAQMKLQRHADRPNPALLDAWIREAVEHRTAIDAALQCAYALKYKGAK